MQLIKVCEAGTKKNVRSYKKYTSDSAVKLYKIISKVVNNRPS